jgi:hypothetical protein
MDNSQGLCCSNMPAAPIRSECQPFEGFPECNYSTDLGKGNIAVVYIGGIGHSSVSAINRVADAIRAIETCMGVDAIVIHVDPLPRQDMAAIYGQVGTYMGYEPLPNYGSMLEEMRRAKAKPDFFGGLIDELSDLIKADFAKIREDLLFPIERVAIARPHSEPVAHVAERKPFRGFMNHRRKY